MKTITKLTCIMLSIICVLNMCGGFAVEAYADDDNSLATTESMQQYESAVSDALFTANTTSESSFTTSTGGTLILDYVGPTDSASYVWTTKVVYFTEEQVVFLQEAMYSEDLVDYIKGLFDEFAVGFVTKGIAKKIAAYVGVSKDVLSSFLGISAGFLIHIVQNLEKWDLQDALEGQETAKVKLEFYQQILYVEPYFLEMANYEPWIGNSVEIPANYNYSWYPNVYDYDNDAHSHIFDSFASNSNGTHMRECGLCGYSEKTSCNYSSFTYLNRTQHIVECGDCGYSYNESHNWNVGNTKCLVCGYNISGPVELLVNKNSTY